MNLDPIGLVNSPLKKIDDCPLQGFEGSPETTIKVFREYQEAMKDISENMKLVVLTWLHQADRKVLSVHPRCNESIPLTGVFTTRSQDRPNPIGIHIVNVLSIGEGELKVSGLEVIDQTPIIDIKCVLNKAM